MTVCFYHRVEIDLSFHQKRNSFFNLEMNSTIQNNIEKYHLWYNYHSLILTFLSPIIGLVSSLSCLIALHTYLKMLHKTFKSLLNIVFIHNILIFGANISIITYIYAYKSQTFLLCIAKVVTTSVPTFSTSFGIAIMSILRYHIALKTNNQESTKNVSWYMKIGIVLYLIFEYFNYGPLTIIVVVIFNTPTVATRCSGYDYQGLSIFPLFHISKALVLISVVLHYDRKMILFLRKKNSHIEPGQAKLVPWKTGGAEYDFMVPVVATITTVICGVLGVSLGLVVFSSLIHDQLEQWKYTAVFIQSISTMEMPIMILLTLRAAKHKKPGPAIPKGPMYHETDSVEEKNEENCIELHEITINENNVNENSNEYDCFSSQDSVSPIPRIIFVKPMIHNTECHI